jgi:hypothetical protein
MSATIPETDTLLPSEAAALIRVNEGWLREATRSRSRSGIPFIKVGKFTRYSKKKLLSWLDEQHRVASPAARRKARAR